MGLNKTFKRLVVKTLDSPARLLIRQGDKKRNVLLTGFPRSGSSLLVNLLNQIPNCVALNEQSYTSFLFSFYWKLRRDIRKGRPIPNKYSSKGEITTNTIERTTHIESFPVEIESSDFVLAHKQTTPYLDRLEMLVEDGWEIWVLVRNPLYTLVSWKRCPAHFSVSQLDPPCRAFSNIPFSSHDLDIRRVETWNYLARRIDSLRDSLHILRYEDLVDNPKSALSPFAERYGLQLPDYQALESRNKPDAYDDISDQFRNLVAEKCESWRFEYSI
jgi:hypothetical protein